MGTHEETELDLYVYNTAELWPMHEQIVQNLRRKIERGTYDPARAPQAWMYWVEAGAKRYAKEFGGVWYQIFDRETRNSLASDIAQREYRSIVNGEYGPINVPAQVRVHENPTPRLLYMYTARINGVYRDVWAVDGEEAVEKFKRAGASGLFTVNKVTNISPRLENPMGLPTGALVAGGLVAAAGLAWAVFGSKKTTPAATTTKPSTPTTPTTPTGPKPPILHAPVASIPGSPSLVSIDPVTNLVLFNTYTDPIMMMRTGTPDPSTGALPNAGVTVNVVDAAGDTLVVPLAGYVGTWYGTNPKTNVLMYIKAADVQSMS